MALIERWHRSATTTTTHQRMKIVEFCAGSGFIGLPLAALYPNDVEVVIIDRKVNF